MRSVAETQLLTISQKWKDQPATRKQLFELRKMGLKPAKDLSKSQAYFLLAHIKDGVPLPKFNIKSEI